MEPLTITVNEACRTLGLGRTKIYELIRVGRLEILKIGKRTLVKTASVRALVDGEA
ncbi:MAG: helix-turn-helix domain-containing protein [Candidatus Sphingomonas colombiensis]|nr:helix-turn-helix domain-containing protein [Sphingomonas sp.]WEK44737.1 MAG: helix-turn-helix domain-containing protein [Sphingomonas sp.]